VVQPQQILSAIDVIATNYKPQKILLFGSYAYGVPNSDSDVDLLVLKNFSGSPHRQFVEIHKTLKVSFPLDLLVRRAEDVEKRIKSNDFFLKEVIENGIVLYAANDAGVGEKGRKRLRRHLNTPAIKKAKPV